LDASRIYLEIANWPRAIDLLDELRGKSRNETRTLIELLLDFARALHEARLQPAPVAVQESIGLLYDGQNARAAHLLVTTPAADNRVRATQWLLAERITAYTPDILLLRPNLYRLETALNALAADGVQVTEPRALLTEINAALDRIAASNTASLVELRDGYRQVVDGLTAMNTLARLEGGRTVLVVENGDNHNLELGVRNLKGVTLLATREVNPYHLLGHKSVLISEAAARKFSEALAK
jgi:hypothetical protein